MNFLKTFILFREKSHPDHEKPFLEHLADLRTMIMRIVITLMIAMILCFFFNNRLMEFFRRPVEQVLIHQIDSTMPEDKNVARPLTTELWKAAMKVEHSTANLTNEQREAYYRTLGDETLVFHAKSVSLLRAAMSLPEDKRENFVASLNETQELKKQVSALIKTKPNTESQFRGNLSMMSALKPTEGFMLSMKLSFVAGIVLSFPLLLMFILQFVLPGLHSNEKRVLWPAIATGFGLFICGTVFAYTLVLPRTLLFFYQWSDGMGISNDWRIGEYISFATQFTLLFGLAFELPVVVMVLVKLELLSYETMSRTRSYAIVAILIAAMVLTPTPDLLTQGIMAAPMLVLYEMCIWLAWWDRRKKRKAEEAARLEAEKHNSGPDDEPPAPGSGAGSSGPDNDTPASGSGGYYTGPAAPTHYSDQDGVMDKSHVTDEGADDGWVPEQPEQESHHDPDLAEKPVHPAEELVHPAEGHPKPEHPDSAP